MKFIKKAWKKYLNWYGAMPVYDLIMLILVLLCLGSVWLIYVSTIDKVLSK